MPRLPQNPVLVIPLGLLLPALATQGAASIEKQKDQQAERRATSPATAPSAPAPARAAGTNLPEKADERLRRAEQLILEEKLAQAETELVEADRLQPDSGPILDHLARVQVRMRKPDATLATLERLVRR